MHPTIRDYKTTSELLSAGFCKANTAAVAAHCECSIRGKDISPGNSYGYDWALRVEPRLSYNPATVNMRALDAREALIRKIRVTGGGKCLDAWLSDERRDVGGYGVAMRVWPQAETLDAWLEDLRAKIDIVMNLTDDQVLSAVGEA